MQKDIKQFILNNLNLIQLDTKESWEELYNKINITRRGHFTEILLSSGIDPSIKLKRLPSYYLNDSTIENCIISDEVTDIGKCAFQKCNKLLSIKINEGVKFINEYAFFQCGSLK